MEIKTKNVIKGTIKNLDKGAVATERMKDTIVNVKEKAENSQNSENNTIDYASDKVNFAVNRSAQETVHQFNKQGQKAVETTKNNIIKTKQKIHDFKIKQAQKKSVKTKIEKSAKGIKTGTKQAIKTQKQVFDKSKKVAKETVKATGRAKKMAQESVKATARATKLAIKATISAVKGIIAATKALVTAIIAGGWVAVVVILIICLIGLLLSSIFGIFFSSEDTGSSRTMNSVITEINKEMADKITQLQNSNIHDDYVIDSDRAEWKDILAIYTVKISKGTNEVDVITIDDDKVKTLKEIFWEMNTVSSEIKTETVKNPETGEDETKQILHIKITSKTVDEMMNLYNFNTKQREQMAELLRDDYAMLWSSVIFGTSVGSLDIVQIALSQVGNVGGQPYWSWYGFNSRVEWCACFVSWVANQTGYIDAGVIPKFAGVQTGIDWFKLMGQWKEPGFTPKPGDIIFFDWENDGKPNHVGIVEKVENGRVYTVEGNSTDDTCRQKDYDIKSSVIFGYGTPAY